MKSIGEETYSPAYIAKILLENKVIASVGVSLEPIEPSFLVMRWLSLRGFTIIPGYVGKTMWGNVTYAEIIQIKEQIDMVQIFRRSEAVPEIVDEALEYLPGLEISRCKSV